MKCHESVMENPVEFPECKNGALQFSKVKEDN